jgi:AcrR family transcriptional regulator
MDNPSRSEKTRNAVIQAALAIIARDGPGRLTLDAIARESGISKGGLMHQFRNKEAVIKALLEHQIQHFSDFSKRYLAENGSAPEPHLAAQIATLRETLTDQRAIFLAILGAVAQEPGLLSITKEIDASTLKAIKAEAADPELATLRWLSAYGLALTAMLGICPIPEKERSRLFDRLLDGRRWSAPGGDAASGDDTHRVRRPAPPGARSRVRRRQTSA